MFVIVITFPLFTESFKLFTPVNENWPERLYPLCQKYILIVI